MKRLMGKVIVVAGGGAIGNEMARRYAQEGADVVIGDFDAEVASLVAQEIIESGGAALGKAFDGSDERSAIELVEAACQRFGGVDGININFANFADAHFEVGVEIPLEVYDEVMRVNARGYLLCTRAALPALVSRGGGSIVYTSSAAAFMAEPVRIAYAMAKASVNALMRGIAKRHGPDKIRSNAIAPGVVVGPKFATEVKDKEAFNELWFNRMALKNRLGEPRDIAAISALLMSDEGSYITGQTISVDAGIVMRP